MLKTLFAIFVVVLVQCQQSVNADEAGRLRVATYNINWGNLNLPAIADNIRQSRADVVLLQETNFASERFLKRQFSNVYPHFYFVGHRGQFAAERFGIFSRHPILNQRFEAPQHGMFGTLYVTVTIDGQAVNFVNTHLSPFGVRRGSSLRQGLSAISATEGVHAKEIQLILKSVNTAVPTLIVGDFNSMSTFQAPMAVKAHGLSDSFGTVHETPDSQPTWYWPLRVGQLQFRIDYIFHTPHFETHASTILPGQGSDHRLVWSEFSLKPKQPRPPIVTPSPSVQ